MATKEAKKVSFNQMTAKDTAKHNDRSMYGYGYEDRDKNVHWDMYGCGSSFEAEARFYEETFKATLEAQNQRALDMRKYDRVMDMETWREKHMPKEGVFQLGNCEYIDPKTKKKVAANNDTSLEFAEGAAQKIVERIEEMGGTVLSWDIHCDEKTKDDNGNIIEGTPHLHVRYLFLQTNKDGNPIIDMKNALIEHGVQPPDPSKPVTQKNNPTQTFTDGMREMLEDYADEIEAKHGNPKVDRVRKGGSHSTVTEYKTKQRILELEAQVSDLQAERDKAVEDARKATEAREKMEKSRKLIAGKSFRRDGKDMLGVQGLEDKRDELQAEVDRLEKARQNGHAMVDDIEKSYKEWSEKIRDERNERVDNSDVWEYLEELVSDTTIGGQERFKRFVKREDESGDSVEHQVEHTFGVPKLTQILMTRLQQMLRVFMTLAKQAQKEAATKAKQTNGNAHEQRMQRLQEALTVPETDENEESAQMGY